MAFSPVGKQRTGYTSMSVGPGKEVGREWKKETGSKLGRGRRIIAFDDVRLAEGPLDSVLRAPVQSKWNS